MWHKLFGYLYKNIVPLIPWIILYYLMSILSTELNNSDEESWYQSGVIMAAFLWSPRRHWLLLFIAFFLAEVTANIPALAHEHPVIYTLIFMALTSTKVLIALSVQYFSRKYDELSAIVTWIVSTIILNLIMAFLIYSFVQYYLNVALLDTFWENYSSEVTGILSATPVIMGFLFTHINQKYINLKNVSLGITAIILLIGAAELIFNGTIAHVDKAILHLPPGVSSLLSLCLLIILSIILSQIWGNPGGSIALLIIAAFSGYYTLRETGPFFISSLADEEPLLIAQCFLAIAALMMMFIRVLTSYKDNGKTMWQIQANYHLETGSGKFHWDNLPAWFSAAPHEDMEDIGNVLHHIHTDDRDAAAEHWQQPWDAGGPRVIRFRFKSRQGSWLWITDVSQILRQDPHTRTIVGCWKVSSTANNAPASIMGRVWQS
ncbi:MASE1 domain-containing protein [Enterobacillus tribolii]|uniref:PAS domain-containing protein n=1 Tax=Enterobacillus tribolii TaxID=1487935 RepID=A0A370QNQ2_9GAMM|nr:MASE1 domain-containing protein [Enterobacillus tribolii]RDK89994.1 PAS domain-containing protein [Enterobacillus tribolii]